MHGILLRGAEARRAWARFLAGAALSAGAVAMLAAVHGAHGRAVLREVVRRHRSEGLGALPGDAVAAVPPVEPTAQARLRAVEARLARGLASPPGTDLGPVLLRQKAPDARLVGWLESWRGDIAERDGLLASGSVHQATLAGARAPAEGPWVPFVRSLPPNPAFASAAAARWHRVAAAVEGDAGSHLAALDADLATRLPPGSVLEVHAVTAVAFHRDNAYLDSVLRGDAPEALLLAWLAEPDRCGELLAEGLRAERLTWAGAVAADLIAGRDVDARGLFDAGAGAGIAALDSTGPDDVAWFLDGLAAAEIALRTGGPIPAPPEATAEATTDPNPAHLRTLVEPLRQSCGAWRRFHAAARCGARIVVAARERGRLPADASECVAWLGPAALGLDGVRGGIPLAYATFDGDLVLLREKVRAPGPSQPSQGTWPSRPPLPPGADGVDRAGAWFRVPGLMAGAR